MGVLSDPSALYAPVGADWSQGDIVLAPTALLWEAGRRPSHAYPQAAPQPDGQTSIAYDLWSEGQYAKAVAVEAFFGPTMVLTDDCALDKEFNARVQQLVGQGVGRAEAIDQAREDPSLDALILVAPIRPYSTLRFVAESAVRTAQAVGYFPVLESDDVDEGYVDFARGVPIDRRLCNEPYAALSRAAKNLLRWKLAQHYAARNVSLDAQIAASPSSSQLRGSR